MDNTAYTTLTRQSGLVREMSVVANNIANSSTAGFRQEGIVFSEFVRRTGDGPSLSMATARIQTDSFLQGTLTQTGGTFDLAIEGLGFFQIETPDGNMLSRAGSFTPNGEGDLVTQDGYRVLDTGGAPIFVPAGANDMAIAPDGTISSQGNPIGQVGVFLPADGDRLSRRDGVMFRTETPPEPALDVRVLQGFIENSNVDPISQMTRMIEVQRAYEMGQSFLDAENERVRNTLQTLIR